MPLTRLAADAFGVVTVVLVSLLTGFGLLCIFYSIYFRYRIQRQDFPQLRYFNGPWVVRITLVLITIWWGLWEIIRLSFLKGSGRVFHALSLKWQENICKVYILSNIGFAEPCLFLTLILLLRASIQRREIGTLSGRWSGKTFGYLLFFCFPVFVAQLALTIIGSKLNSDKRYIKLLPKYFTSPSASPQNEEYANAAICIFPLLNTILHGLFYVVLLSYFVYLGRRMVLLVINKGLKRRIYMLIFSISTFLPLRVIFLGFTVLSHPGYVAFEALVFLAFFVLLTCAAVGIYLLVYCPVVDSLAVKTLRSLENGGVPGLAHVLAPEPFNDTDDSVMANQILLEASSTTSWGRNSDASMKGGSISFRTMLKDDGSPEGFEELRLFSSSTNRILSPPGSPPLPGRLAIYPSSRIL